MRVRVGVVNTKELDLDVEDPQTVVDAYEKAAKLGDELFWVAQEDGVRVGIAAPALDPHCSEVVARVSDASGARLVVKTSRLRFILRTALSVFPRIRQLHTSRVVAGFTSSPE